MKKGFTLIELLVYMAIMGFIIVVAGRVYSDSTSMRVRTQNMTASMEEVNKVAALIKEDLSQMGAKEYKDKSATTRDNFLVIEDVYITKNTTTGDSSSFLLEQGTDGNSKITFKKIAFKSDGSYDGIHEIGWELDKEVLTRSCKKIDGGTGDASCPSGSASSVAMASDVKKFTLIPSTPGTRNVSSSSSGGKSPFDEEGFSLHSRVSGNCSNDNVCAATIVDDGKTVTFSAKNNAKNDKFRHEIFVVDEGDISGDCRKYPFKKDETYTISFSTPLDISEDPTASITSFLPEKDHASIGFRDKDGKQIKDKDGKSIEGLEKDFLFYFPQTREDRKDLMNHHFEFSVSEEVKDACAMFTLAFYSPTAWHGSIRIQGFKVERKNEAYHFARDGDDDYDVDYATTTKTNNLDVQKKKEVKAFELHLEINKRGEIGSTSPKNSDGNSSNGFVIPTPNNGLRPLLPKSS
jgi:prepilin-type N-terminal cleavage/methylation domain-containing protein